ncbi:glutathione peroxidase [Filimonas sp.]|nr:glutathione peroxidase [Filimonas sp.]
MRITILFLMLSFFLSPRSLSAQTQSVYDIQIEALDGGTIDLTKYKGKKILIVNTASKCGYTPQYEGLEKLYEKYKEKLVVIGFPSNNFMFQEPGDAKKIRDFCTKNYGVTFPMAAKIDVKGKEMHPLYVWLTQKKYNHYSDNSVKWNFQKYLLDEKGNLVNMFAPGVEPMSEEVMKAIEK